MNVAEEKKGSNIFLGEDSNNLVMLFAINAILFAAFKFILLVYQMSDLNPDAYYKNIFNWFILPSSIDRLGTRPWTFITYMFMHQKLLLFIANMFWLWVFGYILTDLTGSKKLIPVYIYGGITGALVYIVCYYIIPKLQPGLPTATLIGANASVMAVAVATTTVKPDYRLFPMINGGIPLWIITLLYVILDFATLGTGDPGQSISHLAGAGTGFLFIYQMRRGNDWSIWMNDFFRWVDELFNPAKKSRQRKVKDEFFYKVHGTNPYKRIPNVTQKRIDEILDKINQQGYHFLTDQEKDILKRASGEEEA